MRGFVKVPQVFPCKGLLQCKELGVSAILKGLLPLLVDSEGANPSCKNSASKFISTFHWWEIRNQFQMMQNINMTTFNKKLTCLPKF